jgi:uncharacterized membrane protein
MTGFRVRDYLKSSLWFVPVLCVLAGVALSFGTIALDRAAGGSVVPQSLSGDADAALAILTTVAASMVTLTGLVLTITMVVVQLAMGQFTPRVLRTILRDRPSQMAIGVFVATFTHAMLVMREVKAPSEGDEGNVPGLAIVVAYVLIVISIMVLVSYVHHIGQTLRVASLIDSVGNETRELLDKLYPRHPTDAEATEPELPDGEPVQVIPAPSPGVVYRADRDELMARAREADAVVVLVPRIGDFVPGGAPVLEVYGPDEIEPARVLRSIGIGKERTLHQDLAYGIRMLVDVAQRSASPDMADPTTAVQAVDRLHDLLRQLADRPFPSGFHYDADGSLRLVMPMLSWEGYVHLAVDELRHYGRDSLQVIRRLRAMLLDLLSVALPERRPPLERQLRLVDSMARQAFDDEDDREAAGEPDRQGIGSGRDRVLEHAPTDGEGPAAPDAGAYGRRSGATS